VSTQIEEAVMAGRVQVGHLVEVMKYEVQGSVPSKPSPEVRLIKLRVEERAFSGVIQRILDGETPASPLVELWPHGWIDDHFARVRPVWELRRGPDIADIPPHSLIALESFECVQGVDGSRWLWIREVRRVPIVEPDRGVVARIGSGRLPKAFKACVTKVNRGSSLALELADGPCPDDPLPCLASEEGHRKAYGGEVLVGMTIKVTAVRWGCDAIEG
jgi:hypothetical protein